MTLVLAIGTRDSVITVADRRLTSDTDVVEDDSNKLAVLVTRDARVAVGFSGLAADRLLAYQPAKVPRGFPKPSAYVGVPGSASFRTGAWIPDTLVDEAHSAGYDLAPLVERFADRMEDRVRRLKLPDDQRRLIVVFAGFVYEQTLSEVVPSHVMYVLSNLDAGQPPDRIDAATGWPDDFYAYGYGNVAGVAAGRASRLLKMAEANERPEAIVEECVTTIREAAQNPTSQNVIGTLCSSLVIPKDGTQPRGRSLLRGRRHAPYVLPVLCCRDSGASSSRARPALRARRLAHH